MAYIDYNKNKIQNNNYLPQSFNQFILSSNFTSIKYSLNDIEKIFPNKSNKYILLELNKKANSNYKFFTNHNYGYRCNCTKTQCDKYYCNCFNSGNYCIDCNCLNCKNQPPKNTYSNKRPMYSNDKLEKNNFVCRCVKSSCNRCYCECYKNGIKCKSSCRCIECENKDENGIKVYNEHKCCHENSIYIINKILYIDKNKEIIL